MLKTRQNHCPSALRVTFITCPPCRKDARPHTDFTLKSSQFKKSYSFAGRAVCLMCHFLPRIGRADWLYFQHCKDKEICNLKLKDFPLQDRSQILTDCLEDQNFLRPMLVAGIYNTGRGILNLYCILW